MNFNIQQISCIWKESNLKYIFENLFNKSSHYKLPRILRRMSLNRSNKKSNQKPPTYLQTLNSQREHLKHEIQHQFYNTNSQSLYPTRQSRHSNHKSKEKLSDAKIKGDINAFDVYCNGYTSKLSQQKDNMALQSNHSDIQSRHNQSQVSCTSGRSNVSQRRGRSHRQRSRQSSNRQLPSVGQMVNPNIEIQASPMLIQKQLINNSNQKMLELMSAQKSSVFQVSNEKPNTEISEKKFGVEI